MPDHVAVYLPQSYNFAGQTIVVPADRVTKLDAKPSDVLAFIVSGRNLHERERGAGPPLTAHPLHRSRSSWPRLQHRHPFSQPLPRPRNHRGAVVLQEGVAVA